MELKGYHRSQPPDRKGLASLLWAILWIHLASRCIYLPPLGSIALRLIAESRINGMLASGVRNLQNLAVISNGFRKLYDIRRI
jgi:hypothetical protein